MATKSQYIESVLRGVSKTLLRAKIDTCDGHNEILAAAGTLGNVLAEIGLPTGPLQDAMETVRNYALAALETVEAPATAPKGKDIDGGLKVESARPVPPIPPTGTFADQFATMR